MSAPLLSAPIFTCLLINQILFLAASFSESEQYDQQPSSPLNSCHDKCGGFHIPFPFYSSCSNWSRSSWSGSPLFEAFHLSCSNNNSTTPSLYIHIAPRSYRVLAFFADGVLVESPDECHPYSDLNSFGFAGNVYFGISEDNVVGLYDCEDPSPCKSDCKTVNLSPGGGSRCNTTVALPDCCTPLADHSVWHKEAGREHGFSVFSKYRCRGFSCWVVPRGSISGMHGVKLEWAIPRNSCLPICSANAFTVNATTISNGVRCSCPDGFIGDGFVAGVGCLKSCIKDGREAVGELCYNKQTHARRNFEFIAGILSPASIILMIAVMFGLLKRPEDTGKTDYLPRVASLMTTSDRTQILTYQYRELEEATGEFEDEREIAHCPGRGGIIYHGVLGDGARVLVHKIECLSEEDRSKVITQIRNLSSLTPDQNMARIIGSCIEPGHPLLVVYESAAEGTLEEYLRCGGTGGRGTSISTRRGKFDLLDWSRRLNIATETARLLAFLKYEHSPPIIHHDLNSSYILLDAGFSTVQVFGFELVCSGSEYKGDVCNLGLVLLEMISGGFQSFPTNNNGIQHGSIIRDLPMFALQKMRSGRLEEIVDPDLLLEYHGHGTGQNLFCREQMEMVADLAARCILFGGEGGSKLSMADVAKELVQLSKLNIDGNARQRGPALEETFSNSSLLQMISMSPDSFNVPRN